MKYLDLFSGISAPTVAWSSLGWSAVAFAEIEPFTSTVLKHHYPEIPNLGDVTLVDWELLKNSSDVLIGGSPCQSFSMAGRRQSLEDERGNLALKFCRIANTTNPIFTIYENVPGILSAKQNPFGQLLSLLVGAELPLTSPRGGHKWESSGFVVEPRRSVAWRTLCASHFGVPQRRRRVFVVAFDYRAGSRLFGEESNCDIKRLAGIPAAILLEPEGVPRDTSSCRKSRQKTTKNAGNSSETENQRLTFSNRKPDFWSGNYKGLIENPTFGRVNQNPLTENPTFGRVNYSCFQQNSRNEVRLINSGESLSGALVARLGAKQQKYLVAFSCVDYGQDCGHLSPTLRTLSGQRLNGGGQVAIAYNVTMGDANGIRKDRPHGGIYVNQTEIASTVTCSGTESTTIAFRTSQINANGIGVYTDDKTHTLSTRSDEGVTDINISPRRLTPIECLRLQGFPDDYLDISYNEKPAAKSRKYQAIGNSMAVPVVKWIGERIDKITSLIISNL